MLHIQCLLCRQVFTLETGISEISTCPHCHHPLSLEQIDTLIEGNEAAPDVLPLPKVPIEATRFVGLPYRPEGGLHLARFPLFLFQMLLAGMLLGWITSRIGEKVYLVFVYPLIIGLSLAGLGFVGNCWAKIRNPTLAGFIGAFAGLTAIWMMHYADYRRSVNDITRHQSKLPAHMIAQLQQEPGLSNYLRATAREGMTITGTLDQGFNLGQFGTWIYWALEVGIVLGLAYFGCRHSAMEPFCSRCSQWKEQYSLGNFDMMPEELAKVLRNGHLSELTYSQPKTHSGASRLMMTVCPQCRDCEPIDVLLERANEHAEQIIHLTFPGEALLILENLHRESEVKSTVSKAA